MATEKMYVISEKVISRVLEALSNHLFTADGEYNNYDIIRAEEALKTAIGE